MPDDSPVPVFTPKDYKETFKVHFVAVAFSNTNIHVFSLSETDCHVRVRRVRPSLFSYLSPLSDSDALLIQARVQRHQRRPWTA
jgi:hypothetical protein